MTEESLIGLNQQIEFTNALERQWPDIDYAKTQAFIADLDPYELRELWWMYKEAFYTSVTKPANEEVKLKLRQVLLRYHLLKKESDNGHERI